MKQIPLTQGKFTLVDDDVYEWASQYKWCAVKDGNTFYALRTLLLEDGRQVTCRLHQCIIGHTLIKLHTDHLDGNGLNNQRSNLRFVTNRKNQGNQIVHRNGKLAGTIWVKSKQRWYARMEINGKSKHLGSFKTQQEAHEAYLKAVRNL